MISKRIKQQPMLVALQRVITDSGMSADLEHHANLYSKSVLKAWDVAKTKGYICRVSTANVFAYLNNRRALRTVLLAMVELSAYDEQRDVYRDDGKPSLAECCDALQGVVHDIWHAQGGTTRYWTLTVAGVAYMERGE